MADKQDQADRLAAALRANLRKRKSQARALDPKIKEPPRDGG